MTFLKGQGGRMKGSRNRLSLAFVDALRGEFEGVLPIRLPAHKSRSRAVSPASWNSRCFTYGW